MESSRTPTRLYLLTVQLFADLANPCIPVTVFITCPVRLSIKAYSHFLIVRSNVVDTGHGNLDHFLINALLGPIHLLDDLRSLSALVAAFHHVFLGDSLNISAKLCGNFQLQKLCNKSFIFIDMLTNMFIILLTLLERNNRGKSRAESRKSEDERVEAQLVVLAAESRASLREIEVSSIGQGVGFQCVSHGRRGRVGLFCCEGLCVVHSYDMANWESHRLIFFMYIFFTLHITLRFPI